jgi:AcrR family transcriptional regulator
LYEAMVQIAAADGYPSTTITAVCRLAGVSRQTFYDLFGGDREACFLGAYDHIVARVAERIKEAYRQDGDPHGRLRRAFEQYAREAASAPQAARFALIETLGAGPAALARMDRGRRTFEELIAASLTDSAGRATLSPTIIKGIVGGIERASRVYLLAGNIDMLHDEAHALCDWMSSYRPWPHPTGVPVPVKLPKLTSGLRCT